MYIYIYIYVYIYIYIYVHTKYYSVLLYVDVCETYPFQLKSTGGSTCHAEGLLQAVLRVERAEGA